MALDTETLTLLLDAVRRFVHERLIPAEDELASSGQVPPDIVNEMRELGLFGLSIAPEFGGLGLTMEEEVRVVFELGQTSPAFRSLAGTNIGIGSQAIVLAGTDDQRARYLPKLASGELIGSFALTEPDAGSDAMALRLSAERDGDGYVLNGTKRYITNAPIAGLFTVFARTDPQARGAAGISAFLVERDTPGLSAPAGYRKMGQHGSPVGEVILEGCRVHASAIVGGVPGLGFKTAMKALNKQRINLAGLCIGPAIRLVDEMVARAASRRQFGQAIGEFQLVQQMIAESNTEVHAARALLLETARKRDDGADVTMEASMCKLFASEMCGRVADRAVQVFGGGGYINDNVAERFYRDVRLFRLYEGTSQIHLTNIARRTMARAGHQT